MTTYGLEFMNMIINPWLSDHHFVFSFKLHLQPAFPTLFITFAYFYLASAFNIQL